jgi:hypothetical protein
MNDPQSQAQGLAQFGRHGDSMLMHVNPQEVQGLQSLAQANGTSLTTNPYTGQPEAFNFRSMLKTAAPIAAGFAFGPAAGTMLGGIGATAGGIAAGALTGGAIAAFSDENMLQGALFGGLGGMGGAGLRGAAGAVGAAGQAVPGAAEQLTAQQIANKAALQQTTAGGIGAQTSIPAAQASKALSHNVAAPFHSTGASYAARTPLGGGGIPSWASGSGHQLTHYPQGGGGAMDALKTIGKNPGAVAKQWGGGNALAGYGKMAGTMAMPLMAGYEPPGLSETDIAATHAYDPTRRLDLEGIDTGLRLLANGGDVRGNYSGDPRLFHQIDPGPAVRQKRLKDWSEREAAIQELIELRKRRGKWPNKKTKTQEDPRINRLANGGDVGLGGGDFVAGNFAAGDFAGDDSFGEFAEVTQAGQFDDFNQFSDFANDPILQNEIANDPIFQNTNNFTPEVNQPLPPAGDTQSFTELTETFSPGRFIEGAGDGLSDSIRANIDGQQEARLSDGEFVVPADVVSGIGNGSSDAGSAKLFDMMAKIRKRRTGGTAQPESIRPSDMTI